MFQKFSLSFARLPRTHSGLSAAEELKVCPAKCRAHLFDFGCLVAQEVHWSTSGCTATTCISRENHCIGFVKRWMSATLAYQLIPCNHRITFWLAMLSPLFRVTQSLVSLCIQKPFEIPQLTAKLFKQKDKKANPLYHSDVNHIKIVICTLQNYETVPNRRNMISDTMVHWMYTYTMNMLEDYIKRIIFDWLLLGRYAGLWPSTLRMVPNFTDQVCTPNHHMHLLQVILLSMAIVCTDLTQLATLPLNSLNQLASSFVNKNIVIMAKC